METIVKQKITKISDWKLTFIETKHAKRVFMEELEASGENNQARIDRAMKYKSKHEFMCRAVLPSHVILEMLSIYPLHNIRIGYYIENRGKLEDARKVYYPFYRSDKWGDTQKALENTFSVQWNELHARFASVEIADAFLPSTNFCTCFIFFDKADLVDMEDDDTDLTGIYGDVKTIIDSFREYWGEVKKEIIDGEKT